MRLIGVIAVAMAALLSSGATYVDALTNFTAAARESNEACRAWDWGAAGPSGQRECIDKQKAGVQPKFEAAQKDIAKNKAAVSKLRDFYAVWRATFEDSVSHEEPRTAYDRRTREAIAAINEREFDLS
jgi:hypothetical protein